MTTIDQIIEVFKNSPSLVAQGVAEILAKIVEKNRENLVPEPGIGYIFSNELQKTRILLRAPDSGICWLIWVESKIYVAWIGYQSIKKYPTAKDIESLYVNHKGPGLDARYILLEIDSDTDAKAHFRAMHQDSGQKRQSPMLVHPLNLSGDPRRIINAVIDILAESEIYIGEKHIPRHDEEFKDEGY